MGVGSGQSSVVSDQLLPTQPLFTLPSSPLPTANCQLPTSPPMSDLPSFAKQWAQQWKRAAPALQAIRDQELRQLGGDSSGKSGGDSGGESGGIVAGHRIYDRNPERHGMVIMQRWFMRQALQSIRSGKPL